MTIADAPTPRRMHRPRWLDVRVIGGVLLLIAAVVVGARVIGASSRTTPVWAVAHDLAAGTVLRSGDLVEADVNLGDRGAEYLDASATIDGRMLNRTVHAGELLPASAVGPIGDGRIVSVAVAPDRMAPGVQHGSVIDLYLTSGGQGSGDQATTRLLQGAVTVQSVTAPASGGLSAATSNSYQVALLLSPPQADALVRALPAGDPMVVLRTSGAPGGRGGGTGDDAAGRQDGTTDGRPSPAADSTAPSSGQGG